MILFALFNIKYHFLLKVYDFLCICARSVFFIIEKLFMGFYRNALLKVCIFFTQKAIYTNSNKKTVRFNFNSYFFFYKYYIGMYVHSRFINLVEKSQILQ